MGSSFIWKLLRLLRQLAGTAATTCLLLACFLASIKLQFRVDESFIHQTPWHVASTMKVVYIDNDACRPRSGCFCKLGGPCCGVLIIRALLVGVHIRAPDFWKLSCVCVWGVHRRSSDERLVTESRP